MLASTREAVGQRGRGHGHIERRTGIEQDRAVTNRCPLGKQSRPREDAGEKVGKIPVPPKYQSKDFLKADFWRLRGGLDGPRSHDGPHWW